MAQGVFVAVHAQQMFPPHLREGFGVGSLIGGLRTDVYYARRPD